MDILRKIASEGQVEQRTVFMIEELFRVRRVGFEASGFPVMPPELDLLEEGGSKHAQRGARRPPGGAAHPGHL